MSELQNQWLRNWEVVADHLLRVSYIRDSLPLSSRDCETWGEALLLQGMLMCDLSLSKEIDFRAAKHWCFNLARMDCMEVISVMKEVDSWVTASIEEGCIRDYRSFGRFKRDLVTRFPDTGEIISPVVRDIEALLCHWEPERYRAIHQFLTFMGRVSLKDIPDDSVIEEFVETDRCLASPNAALARAVNTVLREWLAGFRVEGLPFHGPGSTADAGKVSVLCKYAHLGSDALLDYVLQRHGYQADDFLPLGRNPWCRTAKLQCVPKSSSTKRTICMEPATLQYFQQMVRKSLYDYMENHPVIRQHISLRDQSRNRRAAYIGSCLGTIATIDLSKASDSVTWDLARLAFRGTPLLPWMYATRSNSVALPGGEVVAVRKFAPMGSALCFPIECLVFASVCEVAKRLYGRHCSSSFYSVYGDDIAIETEMSSVVISYLEQLGFTVNRDKSFLHSDVFAYRESCGGEYLGGLDVSPLRIPRRFQGGRVTPHHPDQFEGHIDLANRCWDYGFLGPRRWVIHRLMALPGHLKPPFGESNSSLHSYDHSNYLLGRKWSSDLWCYKYRHGRTSVRPADSDESAEKCRLYHWFSLAELNPSRCDGIQAMIGPVRRSVLESTWSCDHWL